MNDAVISRGRGRPPAFKRDVVLERAMQVFWASGYEGASIPKLTGAMGISAQSLYAAFGSKEALYREAIEFYSSTIGMFAAAALEEADAVDAIERLIRDAATTFSRTSGTPGCMIATPFADTTDVNLSEVGHRLRAASTEAIARRLERGIAEGQVRADVDCAAWANSVAAMVQGMSVQARDGATRKELLSTAGIFAALLAALRVQEAQAG